MRPRVGIAGSGLAGLACAAALAPRADVLVFERLPLVGGDHWEDERIRALTQQSKAEGASFFAGSHVLRWENGSALVIGEHTGQVALDALVIATGHRPWTRAELGIEGPRLGGLLPATVALHLLDFGVRFGARPTVIGSSRWAFELVQRLPKPTIVVVPNGSAARLTASNGIEVFERARPMRVEGGPRVAALLVELADGQRMTVETDGVLLAHGRIPYRNVEGAISACPRVVFAQPGEQAADDEAVEAAGRAAAAEALRLVTLPATARIGGPT